MKKRYMWLSLGIMFFLSSASYGMMHEDDPSDVSHPAHYRPDPYTQVPHIPLIAVPPLLEQYENDDTAKRNLLDSLEFFVDFTSTEALRVQLGTRTEGVEERFETYIAHLHLLHGFGFPGMDVPYRNLYEGLSMILHEAAGDEEGTILDPPLFQRCFRLLACFDSLVRRELAQYYREGSFTFPQSPQESERYSIHLPLGLPLDIPSPPPQEEVPEGFSELTI